MLRSLVKGRPSLPEQLGAQVQWTLGWLWKQQQWQHGREEKTLCPLLGREACPFTCSLEVGMDRSSWMESPGWNCKMSTSICLVLQRNKRGGEGWGGVL